MHTADPRSRTRRAERERRRASTERQGRTETPPFVDADTNNSRSYYDLGQVLDALGKLDEASSQYKTFLARASLQDLRRKEAEERVAMTKDDQ